MGYNDEVNKIANSIVSNVLDTDNQEKVASANDVDFYNAEINKIASTILGDTMTNVVDGEKTASEADLVEKTAAKRDAILNVLGKTAGAESEAEEKEAGYDEELLQKIASNEALKGQFLTSALEKAAELYDNSGAMKVAASQAYDEGEQTGNETLKTAAVQAYQEGQLAEDVADNMLEQLGYDPSQLA
jgi:hypothetical protein